MPSKTARAAIDGLLSAMHDYDVEAALAVYEEDATVVVYPGMLGKGTAAIRAFFQGIFRLKGEIEHGVEVFTEAGDLTLFVAKWTILSAISPGLPVHRTNYQVAILRKQPDGSWLIAVDNPWGPEPPPAGAA
ncbi:MAG: nuclear transport factor 2 family protein [Bryobacteraceae bacterium]|jgi:uncharacterized protein (TIGR02246 family)